MLWASLLTIVACFRGRRMEGRDRILPHSTTKMRSLPLPLRRSMILLVMQKK
ncbi:hypothetical protein [Trichocoleus sp. FACHB-6]|uniref:hypothetical protein n=1 Tax=Trichocoleus sp. FACHB-6 TaxID=2692873 RepID=UPI001689D970|nr:hypothetical protein [Trichocoleus sp. FACHB-6]